MSLSLPFLGSSSTSANRRHLLGRAARGVIESLETRRLLCDPDITLDAAPAWSSAIERHVDATQTQASSNGGGSATSDGVSIVWTNRGQASDLFLDTFGTATAAENARKVVDQVLADWAKDITSWNRADGTTTLQISISMNAAGTGFGAACAPSSTSVPADGKPRTASMTIGRGNDTNGDGKGDGAGWYIDPTPGSSSEFMNGSLFNPFAGYSSDLSKFDFYTVTNLELTHALGIITGTGYNGYKLYTSGYTATTTSPDVAEAGASNTGSKGYYATFIGPTISHLMTTNNGASGGSNWGSPIHTAGSAANITINGVNYRGGEDSGNAGYDQARYLVAEVPLRMLADAYGYSIVDPKTLPSLFAQVDDSGVLHVRGLPGANLSNDVITVDQSGSTITTSVNIGNDIPGSGAQPGVSDQSAYIGSFDASTVNSIVIDGGDGSDTIVIRGIKPTTINGGDGNDNIRIHGVAGAANSVSVNGGEGNDSVVVGTSDDQLSDLNGYITINGGNGTDTVRFDDAADPYGDTYTLFGTYFQRSVTNNSQIFFNAAENLYVDSGNGDSEFDVNAIPSGMTYEVNAGGGIDTVSVGNHDVTGINGNLNVHGGSNGDRIILDDLNATVGHTYTVNGTTLQRTDRPNYIAFDGIGSIYAYGGSGSDTFNVTPSSTSSFFINGNSPSVTPGDTLNLSLSGVTGATNTGSSWTFTNRLTVQYASIETQTSTGGNNAPSIGSLVGPSGTVAPNSSFTLTASGANDSDGNLTGVRFYRETNGTSGLQVGSDLLESTVNVGSGGTYSTTLSTSGFTAGVYTYYAVAYDAAAATSASVSTNVSVGNTNSAPTISGLSLSPSSITQGGAFTATAIGAADPDNNLAGVYFYLESNGVAGFQGSDTYLGADTTAGDGYTYYTASSYLVAGTYTLYAQAYDAQGATSSAASATLTVTSPGNHGPQMNGGLYAIPNPVSTNATFALLAGTISDNDGTVTSVNFYRESNGISGLQAGSDTLLGTDTVSNDGWFLNGIPTGSVAGTFTFYATASDSAGYTSQPSSIAVPITGGTPANVVGSGFSYLTAPLTVNFTFDADVGASLDFSDLNVFNTATGAPVAVDSVNWNSGSKTASFVLHGVPADGNYTATLHAAGVMTAAGTPMTNDYATTFFTLGGDTDHNRAVNFTDLLALAKNYGKSGKTYADGDFDYNGTVNFSDLLILAKNYNKTLAAAAPAAPLAAELPAVTTERKRPVDDIVA